MQHIYGRKPTPKCDFNKVTSPWVFSCKFAAYFQNTFFQEHFWVAASANCHHQIVFAKFDLKVFYPSPYERHVWHYKYANAVQIKNALASFNWEQVLPNNSINKTISVLNETIINFMSNYILNETKVIDDQNPPQMNKRIENLFTVKK